MGIWTLNVFDFLSKSGYFDQSFGVFHKTTHSNFCTKWHAEFIEEFREL